MTPRAHSILRFALLPFLGYVLSYFVLTYPMVLSWPTSYFCDKCDGPTMIWNVWWVRQAIVHLHQSPWHTSFVHFPLGTTLFLHCLTPFNGLLAIPLSAVLPSVQVYNALVTFAFAGSGLTCFWLAWRTTRAYWPSLAAGFGFAFCSYRWAHAAGHLHVISTECLPLYLLLLLEMLARPRAWLAIAAPLALFAVLLCDPHQFNSCLIATAVLLAWHFIVRRRRIEREEAIALVLLALGVLVTCGPIVGGMIREGARGGPLLNSHLPDFFSADLLGPFVPDWTWNWHALTHRIWEPIGAYAETSVCIGPAVLIAAIAGCWRGGATLRLADKGTWVLLAVIITALALGPTLYVWTVPITTWMPYRLLQVVIPPLRLGGCPGRMMIVTQLACCVLAAAGLARLSALPRTKRLLVAGAFALAMVLESQPRLQPTYPPEAPAWVYAVRDASQPGAVIDLIARGDSGDLYAQTIHGRPIAFGDLARIQTTVQEASERAADAVERGDFDALTEAGFGFIVIGRSAPPLPLPLLHEDRFARVYRLDRNR